jgi:hypothetical protein
MEKLGTRVRLKGTHITGDIQYKSRVGDFVMCKVWWDAAPDPDTKWINAEELEAAEQRPTPRNSALYDPNPPSKADKPSVDRE